MVVVQQYLVVLESDYLCCIVGVTMFGQISILTWGMRLVGQTHIIVRFMAIRSLADMKTARRIGMSWMIVAVIGAVSSCQPRI